MIKRRLLNKVLTILCFSMFFNGCDTLFRNSYDYDTREIYSTYTDTTYKIKIFYPQSYMIGEEYHLVYLLDGDFHFERSLEIVETFDDIVLIGIGYDGENKRAVDYTYPEDDIIGIKRSGEALSFLHFLNDELKPYITNDMNVSSHEITLVGHSLSGYFSLFALFQDEVDISFDNIIAASPSLFWGESYIFELEQTYFVNNNLLSTNIYTAMGDLDAVHMNLLFKSFTNIITEREYSGLHMKYETLDGTSHMRSLTKSLKNGLLYFEGLSNE